VVRTGLEIQEGFQSFSDLLGPRNRVSDQGNFPSRFGIFCDRKINRIRARKFKIDFHFTLADL
jgi:hypothetical protein